MLSGLTGGAAATIETASCSDGDGPVRQIMCGELPTAQCVMRDI